MEPNSDNSSVREKIIEHLFIGELLKYSWLKKDISIEVSKPEVDNSGYDLIIESRGIIRHVQLKSSYVNAKTYYQKLHVSLSSKPSACIVWIIFDPDTLNLGPFLFFGNRAGEVLPDIKDLKVAKHSKGDSKGNKKERPNIRKIGKGKFAQYASIEELYRVLFL